MSDTETQEGKDSASSPPEQAADEQVETHPPHKKRRRSGKFVRFFFWLVLLGLLASGYWYYLHPRVLDFISQYQALEENVADTQDGLTSIQEVITQVRQQLNQQQAVFPQYESALAATQNELASLAERLRDVESSRSGDWVVAEAQYLVRLANQKLLIGTDVRSAIELLNDADNLLFELGYPEARTARQALANDILRLEQVDEVDYQGIYFRLSGLIGLVNELPLPEIESLDDGSGELDSESALSGWRRWWQAVVTRLEPFFIIRRDTEAEIILSSEQLELQKLRVQILLHEAQLGLMSAEQEIYQDSLGRAAELIESLFAGVDEADNLVGQLDSLAEREVQIEVPEITASLRAVQDLVDYLRNNPSSLGGSATN